MINENDIDQIEQEFNSLMVDYENSPEIAGHIWTLVGNQKARIAKISQYSKMLQMPIALGSEKATVLKSNIDNFLEQFQPRVAGKREVKPLTMHNYYQNTNQFHNPFAR